MVKTVPLVLVHESEAFVAVDKPSGWLSVPGRLGTLDPRPVLGRELELRLGRRVWPVHRLDVEVSGILVFALNAEAHKAAGQWFETRSVKKLYQALTDGEAPRTKNPETAVWTSRIVRGKKRSFDAAHGKPSETRARCLGALCDASGRAGIAWELEPLTGRPHQLRFELSRHGFPILGDALYGAQGAWDADAIALRAVRLDLSGCSEGMRFGLPTSVEVEPLF